MIRPTPGELLRGIREGLQQSVLPALAPGNAQRQLRAALHALGRLERAWDRLPGYLEEDLADMRQTLQRVLEVGSTPPALAARLAAPGPTEAAVPGIGDRVLAQAAAMHLRLQEILGELETYLQVQPDAAAQLELLAALYRRMLARELAANAAAAGEE